MQAAMAMVETPSAATVATVTPGYIMNNKIFLTVFLFC